MPARTRHLVARLAVAPAVLLAASLALVAQPPQPDAGKKGPDPKAAPTTPKAPTTVRLLDGTFQWLGPNAADPDRVLISPQELQKLNDQIDQLRKQLAARRPVPPSGCAIRAKVEKRGETLVAAVPITYAFRTTAANTPVALGGKRAFPVSAALDGQKLPILETAEDGFAALVETPGDHSLLVEYEAPVTGRGTKTEIGFELGLPRAAITTLAFEPLPDVKRVNLTTRATDPTQPKPPPPLRQSLDAKALAPRSGSDGYPLGPVESVELTWDPPAVAAQPTDQVQTADLQVTCKLTDRGVETTAELRPRGTAREWRIAAPATAEVTATRLREPGTDVGPIQPPTVTHPPDPNRPVWKVELPVGASPADWVFAVSLRQDRPKPGDPVAVGPLAVLDVARQTGTVKVSAAGSVRLEFEHGPELHRVEPAAADGTATEFRFATGPTGRNVPGPLFHVRAYPVAGALRVKPTYTLRLVGTAWQVEAAVHVTPVRTEVSSVTVELPADWRSFQAGPPEVVAGVEQDEKAEGPRRRAVIKLAETRRQAFDLELVATSPVEPAAAEAAVSLPLFPSVQHKDGRLEVTERDAQVTATVGPGLEVRGTGREWDRDQPAGWGRPLVPPAGPDGKPPRVATSVTGRFEHGVARVDLAWQPHRPELVAQVRAEVTVERRQVVVVQTVKLQPANGAPRPVRFRGPADEAAGLEAEPALRSVGPGEWATADEADPAATTFRFKFAVKIPRSGSDDRGPWKVPVPLFWPTDATRTDTVVGVWAGSDGVQVNGTVSAGWRELPPEPTADRPALPVATLAGSGTGLPLALDLREPDGPGRFTVWVERGLIRARDDGAGPVDYTARFRLRRWLTDVVELRVPGRDPVILIDGVVRPDATSARDPEDPDALIVRVPLPEPRAEPVELEVRYKSTADRTGVEPLVPPRIRGAAFDGPVRWRVALPGGTVPLLTDGGAAEQRWLFRSGAVVPVAGSSDAALDRWFETGSDPNDQRAGETGQLVVRQATPEPLRVVAVTRSWLLVVCSLSVFLLGLIVSRLPGMIAGPLVALLGGAAAAAAVLYPQPAAQVAGAAEPGLAALVLVLGGLAVGRWYYHRRVVHLPGFARVRPDRSIPSSAGSASPSVRQRPVAPAGSTGSAAQPQPVAPPGA
jgi:hypothetical protein